MVDRIRILHLISDLHFGGASVLLLNNLQEFDKEIFENHVIYFGPNQVMLDRFRALDGVQIKRIPYEGYSTLWKTSKSLEEYLEQNRIQLIHAHLFLGQFFGGVASFLTGLPLLTTLHATYTPSSIGRKKNSKKWLLQKGMDWWLNKTVDQMIAVSDNAASYYVQNLKYDPGKIVVNHSGVRPLKRPDMPDSKIGATKNAGSFVLLGMGRLHTIKGFDRLLALASCFQSIEAKVQIFIAGDGEQRENLESEIVQAGINNITLLGYRENISNVLCYADAILVPSRSESFGLAVIEAMSLGKFAFASKVGGLPEVIEEGENGVFVDFDDPEGTAEIILGVLKDTDLRQKLSKNARDTFHERFHIRHSVRRLESIYLGVLKAK